MKKNDCLMLLQSRTLYPRIAMVQPYGKRFALQWFNHTVNDLHGNGLPNPKDMFLVIVTNV
jgi:hypothetical protein